MFPVALQLYSVRNNTKNDMYGTLKIVKEMGYDGVQFAGLFDQNPDILKKQLDELGLTAIAAHVSYAEFQNGAEAIFETYQKLDCPYIAIPYLEEKYRPGNPEFTKTIRDFMEYGRLARSYNIKLLYHNHDFEFQKLDGKYHLDILFESVPAMFLGTEIDTCWVNVGGVDPAEYILKYSGRAPVVHLKDFVIKNKDSAGAKYGLIGLETKEPFTDEGDFAFRPLGMGMQDIPAILQAAKTAGSKWMIIEQDEPMKGKTPLECAKLSIEYFKTVNK